MDAVTSAWAEFMFVFLIVKAPDADSASLKAVELRYNVTHFPSFLSFSGLIQPGRKREKIL
jgi:hypothetical protein